MEDYRAKVKGRCIVYVIIILIGVCLAIYNAVIMPIATNETYNQGIVEGFIYGLVTSLVVGSIVTLVKSRKALKNDKKLRMMMNEENDERLKAIRAKAGMPLITYLSIALIVIAVVASKFNTLVFESIVGVVLFQLIVAVIVKFYYKAKM